MMIAPYIHTDKKIEEVPKEFKIRRDLIEKIYKSESICDEEY